MAKKDVATITHDAASRKNLPTAEHQPMMKAADQAPFRVAYECRNPELDPQLVWRGKDDQGVSDLVTTAPPLFIQEKVHPKALVDDLQRRGGRRDGQPNLYADFNGLPDSAVAEPYQHEGNWQNRMVLGDSLQVMASLAEREGLRGKVQCIYIDPPYGIGFNSNFQWSTTSREVKDGKTAHLTREPEQVKAFRDTWRDGIHSYLTYMRDRLMVARDLLADSGSVFVQIGAENLHRVRGVLDEVFGQENFVSQVCVIKTATPSALLDDNFFYVLWFGKSRSKTKCRRLFLKKTVAEWVSETRGGSWGLRFGDVDFRPIDAAERSSPGTIPQGEVYALSKTTSAGPTGGDRGFVFRKRAYTAGANTHWKTTVPGLDRLAKSDRLETRGGPPWFRKYYSDSPFKRVTNAWLDTSGKSSHRWYVVQTDTPIVQRCVLLSTDPGDLVLDPTCGSATTAHVAENWGRRWITIDTSRVALALARARIMGACYPYYLLADSKDGQRKEADVSGAVPAAAPTRGDVREGFVYKRVPHVTLKSIANNTEIDVIWERWQETLEPLRAALNAALNQDWQEWEIPREAGDPWPEPAAAAWHRLQKTQRDDVKAAELEKLNASAGRAYTLDDLPDAPRDPWAADATDLHEQWWNERIARQREIDASIAARADVEYLYDQPYQDRRKVRVAGPFTVESLSPHRALAIDEIDGAFAATTPEPDASRPQDFASMILEQLETAGVQQAHKEDRIAFTSIAPWPGDGLCAEGRYVEGDGDNAVEKRAGIFIGPEFGTVSRPDLVRAAREAADASFDAVVSCAFSYDAHASDFTGIGAVRVLRARINADLHMAGELKNTGAGNLFVIFGEPDIEILPAPSDESGTGPIRVKLNGVDVFDPNTGQIRSDNADGIACWFIDTDYNEEGFFVRHAYFLGANDPYKALRTTLKAEIDRDAWAALHSDTSRPFERPASGRIAVKVINHLGDEVMKVFRV